MAIDTAAAAAEVPTVEMRQLTVTISSTGRPVVFLFPIDITAAELLEFSGWLGSTLHPSLVAERAARDPMSRIAIARAMPRPT